MQNKVNNCKQRKKYNHDVYSKLSFPIQFLFFDFDEKAISLSFITFKAASYLFNLLACFSFTIDL